MLPQSLPGIRRIYFTMCAALPPYVMLTGICGGAVAMYRDSLEKIPFAGIPTLKCDGTVVNGSRQEKSSLEFRTSGRLPDGVRLAFIVECVNGTSWLIGSREPNYPVVEYSDFSGDPSGSAAVRTYKITHIGVKSAIPVVL